VTGLEAFGAGLVVGLVIGIGYARLAIRHWYNTGHVYWWQSRKMP
jgi:uncharacterized membrane-anchored protein YhcB (DUF1043 family)